MRTNKPLAHTWALLIVTGAALILPTASFAQTGVATSMMTVDELLRLENEAALNKGRGSTSSTTPLEIVRPKPVPLNPTVDAIYGTESLKADLTISGVSITVSEGSVISGKCRVAAIADRCVMMEPAQASKVNAKRQKASSVATAKPAKPVKSDGFCPVRSCWVGSVATLPTNAQATLGVTPPGPRPLTPLPTANGLPPGAQDFPVTVSPPESLARNEAVVAPSTPGR